MPAALPPDSIINLAQVFHWRVLKTPDGRAYCQFDAASESWRDLSWHDIGVLAGKWKRSFCSLDLPRGARVALLLPNSVTTVGVDQGALAAGLVPVPLHAIDNAESIAYILNDSEACVLVLRTLKEWSAVYDTRIALPHLRLVVLTGESGETLEVHANKPAGLEARADEPALHCPATWLASGDGIEQPVVLDGDDLSAIVYTSGTTGRPKGVMLTHRNVMANVRSVLVQVPATHDDVFLSFLPLSHTFERTAGYYLPVAAGSCVTYARSVGQIAADLKLVRPTVMISVPRIYERFYAKLQETLAAGSQFNRTLFALAAATGWRRFCRHHSIPLENGSPVSFDALSWPLLDLLVAKKIRNLFGGRLRVAVSGGAPLSATVAQCFLGMGVPVVQGYGMTETSPVVAANNVEDNWPDTVGRPLVGVQVRIGDNRELQVSGDSVMKGYWKRPEDTQKAMTDDGWLHTGDQAAIEHGRVRILGRIKEIIVTSTGEKIAPGDLELAITGDPLFDQAYVIGEGRPFLAVLVVLNKEQWKLLVQASNLPAADTEEAALNTDAVRKILMQHIQAATSHFPHYAMPRAIWSTLESWNIQNGLMTPTLKLKRNNLQTRYQAEVDALYQSRSAKA